MTQRTTTRPRHPYRGRLIAGCAAVLLAVTGCTGQTPPDGGETGGGESEASEKSSDGAKIEVADTAVTNIDDSGAGPMATYAIILENPSADVATVTRLEIRLLDESGDPVKDLVADREVVTTYANLIMPGERQAVTNTVYTGGGKVDSVEVKADGTGWFPGDDERFTAVTASDVSAEPEGDGDAVIDFKVTSAYDEKLSPVAIYAVFRDSDGELLGGTAANDAKPRELQPGSNDGEIEVTAGLPSEWDAASTEVFIDPLVTG